MFSTMTGKLALYTVCSKLKCTSISPIFSYDHVKTYLTVTFASFAIRNNVCEDTLRCFGYITSRKQNEREIADFKPAAQGFSCLYNCHLQ